MRAVSDTPETDGSTAENDAEPIRERSHTYRYVITESGSVAGVTNDAQSTRVVYIRVTDDGHGKLTVARVDASGNELSGPAFAFTNSYSVDHITSSVTDQISVHKTLTRPRPCGRGVHVRASRGRQRRRHRYERRLWQRGTERH